MFLKYIQHIFPLTGKSSTVKNRVLLDMLIQGIPYCLQQDSVAVRANIAYRHSAIDRYHGYTLCSDYTGRTALIDPHIWDYLRVSGNILFVQGHDQARALIDRIM